MNKLKTGKGALKDYHRYFADEYDDYAEEPETNDPISHIPNVNKYQMGDILQKQKSQKPTFKHTSQWPKYNSNFNVEVYSQGIFDGICGEKIARYLKISDLAKLLSTCRYFSRAFVKASIWIDQMKKSHKNLQIYDYALSTINVRQYFKYLQRTKSDGIVFDTVSMERDMSNEDKVLMRSMVDFVTVRSQKTLEMVSVLNQKGVLTGDMKISLLKETNQVYVWISGFEIQHNDVFPFSCILFKKRYEEKSQLIQKAYFLNDAYFVIEVENESGENRSSVKNFEVFGIELAPEWYEKKQTALCKQVLKESFNEKIEKIKIENVGEFFVILVEKENQRLWIQVFDTSGKCLYESKDLSIDAGLEDMIISRSVTKSSFSLYLLDKILNVYFVDFSLESGATFKKLGQPKAANEEEEEKEEVMELFNDKEEQQKLRFLNTIKKYHYGKYKKMNEEGEYQIYEYLFFFKEKKFYFLKFDTNELVLFDLPEYNGKSRFYNWTFYEDYLYLLIDTTILIYHFDLNNSLVTLHQKEIIAKSNFGGSDARWILVNPCLTIITSVSSFGESHINTVQLLFGSTQKLLISKKLYPFGWVFDDCNLYDMLEHVEKWQDISILGQEKIECKFEDERLLIQTNLRTYFRDFNVSGKKVNKNKYGWNSSARYDLGVRIIEEDDSTKQENTEKKNNIGPNLLKHENKNHDEKMGKQGHQNWKNVEKKAETEEKIEKKEARKKGDKYFKNVRQNKHREKIFD